MPRPVPAGPPPAPVAQRLVIRYAKRGRMRFASHRDIARSVERGVRKASLPIAYSAGFSPHPKISYAGAAPTGTASEAEYLEIALTGACSAPEVRDRLDAALPDGIDVIEVLELADVPGGIAALRLEGSQWQVILPGVHPGEAARAVQAFLAAPSVAVERHTSKGVRRLDARAAVVTLELDRRAAQETDAGCVILRMVVRHLTPAVRPDDILAALSTMATLAPSSPPVVTRLAQGALGTEAVIDGPRAGAAASSGELVMPRPPGLTAAGSAGPTPALRPTPLSPGWATAMRQEKETRLGEAGTAAADNAAAATTLASAYEQLPCGAAGPASARAPGSTTGDCPDARDRAIR
jgi:radical SAM-linked protein